MVAKVNIFWNKLSSQTWYGLPFSKQGNQTPADSEPNKPPPKKKEPRQRNASRRETS